MMKLVQKGCDCKNIECKNHLEHMCLMLLKYFCSEKMISKHVDVHMNHENMKELNVRRITLRLSDKSNSKVVPLHLHTG